MRSRNAFTGWSLAAAMAVFVGVLVNLAGVARGEDFKFVHPGLLNSREDLARMKAGVAAKQEPIFSGYEVFRRHVESQANYAMRGPRESVGRGADWKGPAQGIYDGDANAAYQCAIMWTITGDKAYADKSRLIVGSWSKTLKSIGGRDRVLGAGLGPFKMVNAAEILRYSDSGWTDDDTALAERCFKNAVYPAIKDFAPFANGNWDTAAIKTMMAIGVFCNDRDMYERALHYYVDGQGNGRLTHYVINETGQCQESGRDSQHSQLGIAHLGDCCQVAWNQGLNLYGYADNRLLKAFEYTAKYNLGQQVPFQEWMDRTGDNHYTHMAPAGKLRAVYEEIFNHYANVMGLAAPYTQMAAEKLRPEDQGVPGPQGVNGADHAGFGTLLFSAPRRTIPNKSPFGVPAAPAGVIATGSPHEVKLTWIESIDAAGYSVKRSPVAGGPYSVLEKNVKNAWFTDQTVQSGKVYYYVVSAFNAAGESADACEVSVAAGLPPPWQQQDIGPVAGPGWSKFDGQMFTLDGAGSTIGGTGDRLQFAYMPAEGDVTITARHVPQVNSQHLEFGLMMRQSTEPDSPEVAYLIRRGGGGEKGWSTVLLMRPTAGASAVEAASQKIAEPTVAQDRLMESCWLRLARAGNTFTASFSGDGQRWSEVGTIDAGLSKSLLAGIGVCSRLETQTVSSTTTVMMDHVAITGGSNPSDGNGQPR